MHLLTCFVNMALSGFLNINKPKNWTSFDVVAKVRGLAQVDAVGHAGTLDPFATGVLVVALGRARLLIDAVQGKEKVYRGRIRLGQISDSDDVEGHKTSIPVRQPPSERDIAGVIAQFTGTIQQVPPRYSALRVQGRRMYELARKGIPFERPARAVTIHQLKVLSYNYPALDVEVRVSKGTYIRALARDIGQELGTGGFLEELVRTSIGPFDLESARAIDDLQPDVIEKTLYKPEIAVDHLPRFVLPDHDLERLAHGQRLKAPPSISGNKDLEAIAGFDSQNNLVMLLRYDPLQHELVSRQIIDEKWLR
jgi:tRNA pseudouridine55 synthase